MAHCSHIEIDARKHLICTFYLSKQKKKKEAKLVGEIAIFGVCLCMYGCVRGEPINWQIGCFDACTKHIKICSWWWKASNLLHLRNMAIVCLPSPLKNNVKKKFDKASFLEASIAYHVLLLFFVHLTKCRPTPFTKQIDSGIIVYIIVVWVRCVYCPKWKTFQLHIYLIVELILFSIVTFIIC